MMEAMIPSQVGMSLRTLQKIKEAKKPTNKNREKGEKMIEKREGAMLLSFFHTFSSK